MSQSYNYTDHTKDQPRSTPEEIDIRVDALTQAVQHHGLAAQADAAIPSAAETVIGTAKLFEDYINTGTVPIREKHDR